jgi:TRAP-type mannitol/chloroaromatic compound transport system substrate-binding protein
MMAPYDDEKFLGATEDGRAPIYSVAPYCYCPSRRKGETQLHLVISRAKFAAPPKARQAALRWAAALGALKARDARLAASVSAPAPQASRGSRGVATSAPDGAT